MREISPRAIEVCSVTHGNDKPSLSEQRYVIVPDLLPVRPSSDEDFGIRESAGDQDRASPRTLIRGVDGIIKVANIYIYICINIRAYGGKLP